MMNTLDGIISAMNLIEKRISELEDVRLETETLKIKEKRLRKEQDI